MGVLPVSVMPKHRPYDTSFGSVYGNRTNLYGQTYLNGTSAQFGNQTNESTNFVDNVAFAIPLGVGLSTLSLLTFLGNAMVVHAIRTERKLHTVSNMFILSLAIADLIVGLIVMPISSIYVLFADWILGIFVCQLWLVIDYTASTASIFNLLILSLDRYWSIRSPLKYLCKRTKKRALVMIAIVWMISALWAIPIIGWHIWYNTGVRKHPNNVCETEFSDSVAFKVTTSIANFIVPMSLIVIIYYKIFCEIKRRGNFSEVNRSVSRVSCVQHRKQNAAAISRTSTSSTDGNSHSSRHSHSHQQQHHNHHHNCQNSQNTNNENVDNNNVPIANKKCAKSIKSNNIKLSANSTNNSNHCKNNNNNSNWNGIISSNGDRGSITQPLQRHQENYLRNGYFRQKQSIHEEKNPLFRFFRLHFGRTGFNGNSDSSNSRSATTTTVVAKQHHNHSAIINHSNHSSNSSSNLSQKLVLPSINNSNSIRKSVSSASLSFVVASVVQTKPVFTATGSTCGQVDETVESAPISPILRDIRLEHLSCDNGHRIVRNKSNQIQLFNNSSCHNLIDCQNINKPITSTKSTSLITAYGGPIAQSALCNPKCSAIQTRQPATNQSQSPVVSIVASIGGTTSNCSQTKATTTPTTTNSNATIKSSLLSSTSSLSLSESITSLSSETDADLSDLNSGVANSNRHCFTGFSPAAAANLQKSTNSEISSSSSSSTFSTTTATNTTTNTTLAFAPNLKLKNLLDNQKDKSCQNIQEFTTEVLANLRSSPHEPTTLTLSASSQNDLDGISDKHSNHSQLPLPKSPETLYQKFSANNQCSCCCAASDNSYELNQSNNTSNLNTINLKVNESTSTQPIGTATCSKLCGKLSGEGSLGTLATSVSPPAVNCIDSKLTGANNANDFCYNLFDENREHRPEEISQSPSSLSSTNSKGQQLVAYYNELTLMSFQTKLLSTDANFAKSSLSSSMTKKQLTNALKSEQQQQQSQPPGHVSESETFSRDPNNSLLLENNNRAIIPISKQTNTINNNNNNNNNSQGNQREMLTCSNLPTLLSSKLTRDNETIQQNHQSCLNYSTIFDNSRKQATDIDLINDNNDKPSSTTTLSSSTTTTKISKTCYLLEGNHYPNVKVQVEYISNHHQQHCNNQNGLKRRSKSKQTNCQPHSKSASDIVGTENHGYHSYANSSVTKSKSSNILRTSDENCSNRSKPCSPDMIAQFSSINSQSNSTTNTAANQPQFHQIDRKSIIRTGRSNSLAIQSSIKDPTTTAKCHKSSHINHHHNHNKMTNCLADNYCCSNNNTHHNKGRSNSLTKESDNFIKQICLQENDKPDTNSKSAVATTTTTATKSNNNKNSSKKHPTSNNNNNRLSSTIKHFNNNNPNNNCNESLSSSSMSSSSGSFSMQSPPPPPPPLPSIGGQKTKNTKQKCSIKSNNSWSTMAGAPLTSAITTTINTPTTTTSAIVCAQTQSQPPLLTAQQQQQQQLQQQQQPKLKSKNRKKSKKHHNHHHHHHHNHQHNSATISVCDDTSQSNSAPKNLNNKKHNNRTTSDYCKISKSCIPSTAALADSVGSDSNAQSNHQEQEDKFNCNSMIESNGNVSINNRKKIKDSDKTQRKSIKTLSREEAPSADIQQPSEEYSLIKTQVSSKLRLSQCSMCGISIHSGQEQEKLGKNSLISKVIHNGIKRMSHLRHDKKSHDTSRIQQRQELPEATNTATTTAAVSEPSAVSQSLVLSKKPPNTAQSSLLSQPSLSSRSSSFRESMRFKAFHFSRPRNDSIAMPANEFCDECRCVASAVSAAARHRNALRREESSRLRQEKKAARQLGVILGAFILCWMPYIITYIVTAYCTYCISLTAHQMTIWLGYLNSFLNPFLYALCNENFKHAFKKMLGRATPPKHFSNTFDQQTLGTTGGGASGSKAQASFR